MKLKKFLRNLLLIPALIFSLLGYPAVASAARTIYGFFGLTGVDPGLAGLNTTNIDDGSYAFGIDSSGYAYFYYLEKDTPGATLPQSIPGVIAPTTGTGRWILAPRIYSDSFYSNAADLYHYLNVGNTSTPSFTPADGDFYVRLDTGISYVYNAADAQHVPTLNSKIVNIPIAPDSGSQTLFPRHMYGCTVNNVNANGVVTYVLQKAAYGMQVTIYIASAYGVYIDPNASDRIYPTCSTNGDRLYNSGTAGDWVTLKTMFTPSDGPSGDYNWYIFSINTMARWTDAD